MPRPHRYVAPGAYYHVTARGNDTRFVFLTDDDRVFFLHLVGRIARRYGWRIHICCLMGTHYHLVVETPEPNLPAGMRDLNGGYARGFNAAHGCRDHLFGQRYAATVIEDDDQYAATIAYVENNPVTAGLAATPDEWRWTIIPG